MLKTFRQKNYLGNAARSLPLTCRACGHIITEGEPIHSTRSSNKTNYLCQPCYDKPVLVYPLKAGRPPKPVSVCLNWKPCKHTGDTVTSRLCTCTTTRTCIWRLATTLNFILTTKMKPWELFKMKNKYAKQAISLG